MTIKIGSMGLKEYSSTWWECKSNSYIEYWVGNYIVLRIASYHDFSSLAMEFSTHLKFPIHYETRTELLTSLCQNTSTDIYNHIH